MRRKGKASAEISTMQALLLALSDDIALPLLQIRSGLELIQQDGSESSLKNHTNKMLLSAESGLHLIEGYRLALRTTTSSELQMEPLAIATVLQEVAHKLTLYAKEYSTEIEVEVQPRLTPALADHASLSVALEILSGSIIRAQAANKQQKRYRVLLGARRIPENVISTGVFSSVRGLSDKTLKNARSLAGRARQPLPAIPAGAASGILIADMLCSSLWQPLRAVAYRNMYGLATAIPISKQLQII